MACVEVYSKFGCVYCERAANLLAEKGIEFEEIDIGMEPGRRQEMIERSGGRFTVPQIFIDGRHVGGSDDLASLEAEGRLDSMLEPG